MLKKCRWRLVLYAGTPLADGSYTISVIANDTYAGNQKNSLPITVTRRQYADRAGDCAGSE